MVTRRPCQRRGPRIVCHGQGEGLRVGGGVLTRRTLPVERRSDRRERTPT